MKKILISSITFMTCSFVYPQMGQLENGGMETWVTTNLFETPSVWMNTNTNEWRGTALVSKSTDAQHLSYSIKLDNDIIEGDSIFGYFYIGNPNGPSLKGVPYSSNFNGISGFYKCQTAGTDTVLVIVAKSYLGVPYPPVLGKIYGNVSTWTAFNFPVPAGPCDSVFVGAVNSNPFDNSNYNTGTWSMFDNISFTNTSGPTPASLPNPSFETWTTVSVADPLGWDTFNDAIVGFGLAAVTASTDAYSGTYSAEITTHAHPQWNDTVRGVLTNGVLDQFNWVNPTPYTAEPANFSCYYKYLPAGTDMAEVHVQFFQAGFNIGGYYGLINTPTTSYTLLSGSIVLGGIPDSMMVIVLSGNNPGSVLYIDEMSLSGGNVGLEEMANKIGFKTYPNPSNGFFNIEWIANDSENLTLTIQDLTGRVLLTQPILSLEGNNFKTISIDNLPAGSYTYYLYNTQVNKSGIIIKK